MQNIPLRYNLLAKMAPEKKNGLDRFWSNPLIYRLNSGAPETMKLGTGWRSFQSDDDP